MEYNYTKEFKQPHKIYGIGDRKIPFLSNGVRLEQIVVFGVFLVILGIFFLFGLLSGNGFLHALITKSWILMIAGVGVIIWTLFSLKWDNKNFIDYLIGRGTYFSKRNNRYEHGLYVPIFRQKVTYSDKKTGREA